MPSSALRPVRLLIYAVVLAVCVWSLWRQWPQRQAEPLPWLDDWRQALFVPLAGGELEVRRLREWVTGRLWLAPRGEAGPRLLYRADWRDGAARWRLEAELALSDRERASLLDALGARAEDEPQELSDALLDQLGGHRLAGLLLKPEQEVRAERLSASLGAPRVRFRLPEGGEAWFYPQAGLTLFYTDGRLDLLQVAPLRP